MNFVLDASVALAWCFEDEGGAYAPEVLASLRHTEAVVASLWPLEVCNGLVVAERRDRLDAAAATRFIELLRSLPIVVDPVARRRALTSVRALARARDLSAYDASYLELAVRLGVPLATLDSGLRRAARKEGVARFTPE